MYQPITSPRERAATVAAVALIHVALVLALMNLAGTMRPSIAGELTQLINIAAMPPPPPDPVQQSATRPEKKPSAASAKNIESEATPVFAPKPVIELPSVQPMIASPTPGQGAEATQGASDVVGPGTGAGGSGTGTGSGGDGAGAGGSGVAERARLLTPSLRSRDYPSGIRGRWPSGASPLVMFTVQPDGRVSDCRIFRSSGDPVIDMVTCSLVTARFVYRPAYDQRGQPVASQMAYEQRNYR